jgi:hypothetical protein
VRGLAAGARGCFAVCDDAAGFARAMQQSWAPAAAGTGAQRQALRAPARLPYTAAGLPAAVQAALAAPAA